MISLAKMNVNSLELSDKNQKTINNISTLLKKSLIDIRYLNKQIKLRENLDINLERQIDELINLVTDSSKISFTKIGQVPQLNKEKRYLLFRILQELFSNILKYSEATQVEVKFQKDEIT